MRLRKSAGAVAASAAGSMVVAVLAYAGVSALTAADAADGDSRLQPDREGLSLLGPAARVLVREVDEARPRADGPLYELSADGEARRAGELRCKRVYALANGPGLCLARSRGPLDYEGIVFDDRYRPQARFQIDGAPDRARISPDGRYAAYTTFDAAGVDGYFESTADFSTGTEIVDMRSGRELLDLENVAVEGDGSVFDRSTSEVWGVTFARGGRYYATLANEDDGRTSHYLIAGDVRSEEARVIGEGVECPSLSPDGERIAYKRRIGRSNHWRLHVRDLDGGNDVALAETRSIDDQPEWIGDRLVAYSDDEATFVVPADGGGEPVRLAEWATSPAVLASPAP